MNEATELSSDVIKTVVKAILDNRYTILDADGWMIFRARPFEHQEPFSYAISRHSRRDACVLGDFKNTFELFQKGNLERLEVRTPDSDYSRPAE